MSRKSERENISKIFLDEKKKQENELSNKLNINKQTIMKEIELKTKEKVLSHLLTKPLLEKDNIQQIQCNQDALQSILCDSAKEFKEKMGRNMTYSEMRELYG
jgi:hypothetical protein